MEPPPNKMANGVSVGGSQCLDYRADVFRIQGVKREIEFAAKEKLEIVASLCEAKTAKESEKYRLKPHFACHVVSFALLLGVKENFKTKFKGGKLL